MSAVSKSVAIDDINRWLDAKRIREKKREQNKDLIDVLVEAVEDGILIVQEDNSLTMDLAFGIGEGESIKKLTFKPRLRIDEVKPHLERVKSSDGDGRLMAYVTALTGQPTKLIYSMDTSDQSLATSIALFFL